MLRLVAVADLNFSKTGITDPAEMELHFKELWNEFLDHAEKNFDCKVSHNEAAILMNRRGKKTGPLNRIVFRGSRTPKKVRKSPVAIDHRASDSI